MSCNNTNLNCSNGFNVNCGFNYEFDVSIDGEDFTGRTFHFKVKSKKSDTSYLLELTNTTDPSVSGVYIPAPASGSLSIVIKGSDSVAIEKQNAVYEFYYNDGSDDVLMFSGRLEFVEGVL